MPGRRAILGAGCAAAMAVVVRHAARGAPGVVEIHMRSDDEGSFVGFDPVGVLIQPGQTVRWVCDANVHTTAAYHPANGGHSLRIPRAAKPWASDFLMPGEHFEIVLTAAGVYDYFCAPHEQAGMVGRIIVGMPGGPGNRPFDSFKNTAEGHDWLDVPAEARAVFPSVAEIMHKKVVASTMISPVICRGVVRPATAARLSST